MALGVNSRSVSPIPRSHADDSSRTVGANNLRGGRRCSAPSARSDWERPRAFDGRSVRLVNPGVGTTLRRSLTSLPEAGMGRSELCGFAAPATALGCTASVRKRAAVGLAGRDGHVSHARRPSNDNDFLGSSRVGSATRVSTSGDTCARRWSTQLVYRRDLHAPSITPMRAKAEVDVQAIAQVPRKCIRCGAMFTDATNGPKACRFHGDIMGNTMGYNWYEDHHYDDPTLDDIKGPRYARRWACCQDTDENAPPCKMGWHISYDDDSVERRTSDLAFAVR